MNRNERIRQSQNYKNGVFQNISPTPVMAGNVSFFSVLQQSVTRPSSVRPSKRLPNQKTDLVNINPETPTITWFGHSSYLIQMSGTNILVDPVFSGHASPLSFLIKAFPGAEIYSEEDLPEIDMLILTHNHYDHFDAKTITRLKQKTRYYYTALGVGNDLEKLGIAEKQVTEFDWWESRSVSNDIKLTATPARHFSGRGLKRGGSLWTSFVLQLFGYTIFIGGDSGYDSHFKTIGEKFGVFDLAILECGQYNTSWPFIHMMPEQTVQASVDLSAKWLMPVHWAKFTLANHPWNEPVERAAKKAAELNVKLTTPMIGEPVVINGNYPVHRWWVGY
ncbi:MAG TPA: MBL fold metallo-hydrolase [Agriterribacter sp.]|nr:MBL fold metallo-hydrolase [Agriterribacter sp.]